MAELRRRTLRLYDDEMGREIVNMLDNIVNTGKGANERLVEDVYIGELLRKHYQKPLLEVFVMLTSAQLMDVTVLERAHEATETQSKLSINVHDTLAMLDNI